MPDRLESNHKHHITSLVCFDRSKERPGNKFDATWLVLLKEDYEWPRECKQRNCGEWFASNGPRLSQAVLA
jgi:hypothetical protein